MPRELRYIVCDVEPARGGYAHVREAPVSALWDAIKHLEDRAGKYENFRMRFGEDANASEDALKEWKEAESRVKELLGG